MTSSITQMPVGEEFVRAFAAAGDGEKVVSVALYPLRGFRVPSVALDKIVKDATQEANKFFDVENLSYSTLALNHHVNTGLAQLDVEGKIIHTPKLSEEDIKQLHECTNQNAMMRSQDGYTVFFPGVMLPTPSPETH